MKSNDSDRRIDRYAQTRFFRLRHLRRRIGCTCRPVGARGTRRERLEGDGVDAEADVLIGYLNMRCNRAQELAQRCFLRRRSAMAFTNRSRNSQSAIVLPNGPNAE